MSVVTETARNTPAVPSMKMIYREITARKQRNNASKEARVRHIKLGKIRYNIMDIEWNKFKVVVELSWR